MIRVRDAVAADAPALAAIHVAAWQNAYKSLLPASFLDGLSVAERLRWRQGRLARMPPRWATLVVEDGTEVAGFSDTGPGRDLDLTADGVGELYAMYLDPLRWRRGLGRELMAETERRLRADGFTAAFLWVFEQNQRARRFYEAAGWHDDGGRQIESIAGVEAPEVRYRRAL